CGNPRIQRNGLSWTNDKRPTQASADAWVRHGSGAVCTRRNATVTTFLLGIRNVVIQFFHEIEDQLREKEQREAERIAALPPEPLPPPAPSPVAFTQILIPTYLCQFCGARYAKPRKYCVCCQGKVK